MLKNLSARSNLKRRIWVFLVVGLGLIITAVTAHFVYDAHMSKKWLSANDMAKNHTSAISYALRENFNYLKALHAYFNSGDSVSQMEFATFTQELIHGSSGIHALEWIPRVPHEERESYEATAQRLWARNFSIIQRGPEGTMEAAPAREEYYPVYYVEPIKTNRQALGFDLASNPERRAALELSRDTGQAVMTQRITLVQETGKQFGFLVFFPVYKSGEPQHTVEDRQKALKGFVLGVFRISDVVNKAITGLPKDNDVSMAILDRNAPKDQQLLYALNEEITDWVAEPSDEAHAQKFILPIDFPVLNNG